MNVRYRVDLSQAEREELSTLLAGGKRAVRKLKRAQILLAADAGVDDETIAKSVGVGGSTVYRTKRRFVEGNLEAALNEEPRPGGERKLTGKQEALLVATACSDPPTGRKRWTLELLAERWSSSPSMTPYRARPYAGAWPRTISNPGAGTCGASLMSIAPMSPGWKTCSTSMPKGMTQSDPSCASMKVRISLSARRASRSRPSRASQNAMIVNTDATGRSISLSSSTRISPGARSRSPNSAPRRTLPHACAILSISITLRPTSYGSFWTISRPILRARSMKPFRRQKPTASCAAWNSTSRPNTPVGSTWSKSRSACYAPNASTGASTKRTGWSPKLPHGKIREISQALASNGCSQPSAHGPNWLALIQPPSKSHNRCAELLVEGCERFGRAH